MIDLGSCRKGNIKLGRPIKVEIESSAGASFYASKVEGLAKGEKK
jgi:hypothetical protein